MPDSLLDFLKSLFDGWERNAALLTAARSFLIYKTWWWMTAFAVLSAPVMIMTVPGLVRAVRGVRVGAWMWIFWIFNCGAALRIFWTLRLPQVYYDEISFLQTSKSLALQGLNNMGSLGGEPSLLFLPCPMGWQYLVALVFKAVGVDVASAANFSCLLSCLDVFIAFLAVYLLFRDERWALGSALLVAVHPVTLRLSGSMALENGSLFFLLVSVLFLALYVESRSGAALASFFLSLGWLGNMRMENAFTLIPLLLILLVIRDGDLRATVRNPLTWCGFLLMGASLFPALVSDWYGLATRFYYFHESRALMKAHISMNFVHNFLYWVENRIHPLVMTMLAAAGSFFLRRKDFIFWVSWFFLLIIYYSMNPSCDFALSHTLDSWRNALHPLVAVFILAGAGFSAVGLMARPVRKIVTALLLAILLLVPWQFEEFVHTRHPWMRQFAFQQSIAHLVPGDALLLADGDFTREVTGYNLASSMQFSMGRIPILLRLNDQFIYDIYQWRRMEKRRVFIYYLSFESEWDREHLTALLDCLETRLAARERVEASGYLLSFNLLEVKGLKKPYEKKVLDE
jgi:hypothetical protein